MIRIRPYRSSDEEKILSWCDSEETYNRWTFGVLGEYPITKEQFHKTDDLWRFTAEDEGEPVGFFTARCLKDDPNGLRFGYALIDPKRRNKGIGKAMLQNGLDYAFQIYGAEKVMLGVLEENLPGYACYTAIGFSETGVLETYTIKDVEYRAIQMERRR